MILILSDKFDTHADIVIQKFLDRNLNYFRLNLDVASLQETSISFDRNYWTIIQNEKVINSKKIKSIWARRVFVEVLLDEDIDNLGFKIWRGEWNQTLLGFYHSLRNKQWLNSLQQAYRAENKYFQLSVANDVGFLIPKYFVSNNKLEIENFLNENETVLKPQNQEFYKDKENNIHKGMYVNKIDNRNLEYFSGLNENPIFIQHYIEKKYEVRYTFVNGEHFACRIESQNSSKTKIDWRRYDIPNTPHYSMNPPDEIKRKVSLFMDNMDLKFGALDFIVTPDHDWFFLEVNPMGQWLWIENLTNLEISNAIANFYSVE